MQTWVSVFENLLSFTLIPQKDNPLKLTISRIQKMVECIEDKFIPKDLGRGIRNDKEWIFPTGAYLL
jgi:hypothetical protein